MEDFNEEEVLFEGVAEESIKGNTKEGKTDMATQLPSLKEQLSVVTTAKQILSGRDGTKYTSLRAIADVQALLRKDVTASSRHTLIKDFFTNDQSTLVL